jgi:predicted nucleic acid-binding protein
MTVVDASAVAGVAFTEPEGEEVTRRIAGVELAAPRLLPFELANIARNKMRRRPDAAAVIAAQLRTALAITVTHFDVNYLEVFALAAAHGLTAYDASYVWLARHLKSSLVTLDAELVRAMSGPAPSAADSGTTADGEDTK